MENEQTGTVVLIEQEIYERIRSVVERNNTQWATMKQFVNLSCLRMLEREEEKLKEKKE